MFLQQIALANFKCFSNFHLRFYQDASGKPLRNTTLLTGQNGTGKSGLLQATALITAGRESLSALLKVPEEWIKTGASHCLIAATILDEKDKPVTLSLRIDNGKIIHIKVE